jgi:ribosome maturation factor RimP
MALMDAVTQTVTGLGYDLVEVERTAGGTLRVTIDNLWPDAQGELVTVEDCEKVTRQLQFVLEVEGVDYKRLEVSSPGIDRPLRHEKDFERFAGEVIDITLKAPIAEAATPGMAVNRKKFRGTLEKAAGVEGGWQIVWSDEPEVKPGARVSKKRQPAPLQVMGFVPDELKDARLAPIVDFKGRKPKVQE